MILSFCCFCHDFILFYITHNSYVFHNISDQEISTVNVFQSPQSALQLLMVPTTMGQQLQVWDILFVPTVMRTRQQIYIVVEMMMNKHAVDIGMSAFYLSSSVLLGSLTFVWMLLLERPPTTKI